MNEAMSTTEERRSAPRVPTRFPVHCRRLGRGGIDDTVEVVDLSMGGMRIVAPEPLQVGDVVELTVEEGIDPLVLFGLVVGTTVGDEDGERFGNIAFTRLVPSTLEHIGFLVDLKAGAAS
jgi:hypothetical protein